MDKPKCLLEVKGKSILERQIELLRRFNINDIVIVKGFAQEKINIPNVSYVIDEKHCYDKVYSLMEAKEYLNGDVLVIYGDILYDESVLEKMLANKSDGIQVAVDIDWKDYFTKRYGDPLADTVSLHASSDDYVLDIGQNNPALSFSDIYGQFIGFLKLTDKGCQIFKDTYFGAKKKFWGKEWINGRSFEKVRTTDFLQIIVDSHVPVKLIPISKGWLEFDDVNDLDLINKRLRKEDLDDLCKLY